MTFVENGNRNYPNREDVKEKIQIVLKILFKVVPEGSDVVWKTRSQDLIFAEELAELYPSWNRLWLYRNGLKTIKSFSRFAKSVPSWTLKFVGSLLNMLQMFSFEEKHKYPTLQKLFDSEASSKGVVKPTQMAIVMMIFGQLRFYFELLAEGKGPKFHEII
eukprot:UN27452